MARFNGAADVHPRNHRLPNYGLNADQQLQWGRGCSSAESCQPPIEFGELEALQWGRGCSSAESRSACAPMPWATLQWGRGCSSAESSTEPGLCRAVSSFNGAADVHPRNRCTAKDRPGASRFNGAADVHPRNRRPPPADYAVHARASMGPRMFIRGILRRAVAIAVTYREASMGPRMFIRGIDVQRERRRAGTTCFNGAADVHPRNPGSSPGAGPRSGASMGPRMFIRGICPRPRANERGVRASMGPRMFIRGIAGADSTTAGATAWLQWGRGCSSAESSAVPGHDVLRSSFNGAADVHPRNLTRCRRDRATSP